MRPHFGHELFSSVYVGSKWRPTSTRKHTCQAGGDVTWRRRKFTDRDAIVAPGQAHKRLNKQAN